MKLLQYGWIDAFPLGTPARPFRFARVLSAFALGSAMVLISTGCQKQAPAVTPPPPPTISVSHPIEMEIVEFDEYTGRVEAVETVEIRSRVSGYLQEVHFRDGQIVKEGDLLFTIDPRPYEASVAQAEGDQSRLVARVERLTRDVERYNKLVQDKVISRQEFERTVGDLSEAKGELASAQAAVDRAKLDLGYTRIAAPIAGRISRHTVSVGNLIAVDSMNPLTSIVSIDPMYVYCDCSERNMLRYQQLAREGSRRTAREARIPMFIGLDNEQGTPHEGFIDFVDNQVNPRTGTIRARGLFANTDDYLTPGLFARIRIPGSGKKKAVLIPERAIGSDQGQRFVLVVGKENKVEVRPITIGSAQAHLRVVEKGLTTEDAVVAFGTARVRPGATIVPQVIEVERPEDLPLSRVGDLSKAPDLPNSGPTVVEPTPDATPTAGDPQTPTSEAPKPAP